MVESGFSSSDQRYSTSLFTQGIQMVGKGRHKDKLDGKTTEKD